MSHKATLALIALGGLSASQLACKADDGDDTGPDGLTGTLVQEVRLSVDGVAEAGLEGATVAVDDASGARVAEVQTDAEGIAEVAVDWSLGPYSVTVDPHLDPPRLWSRVGAVQGDDPAAAVFWQASEVETVHIDGTVPGHDASKLLLVVAYGPGADYFQGSSLDASFGLDVVPDTPFELLAVDFTWADEGAGWTSQTFSNWRLQAGQVSEGGTFDMSTSTEATPVTASLELLLPEDPESPLRDASASAYGMVLGRVQNSYPSCGYPTLWGPASSGDAFELDFELVVPDITEESVRQTYVTSSGGASYVFDWGEPEAWLVSRQLLPVPAFAETVLGGETMEGWSFTLAEPGESSATRAVVEVVRRDGSPLWTIVGPPDVGTLVLPRAPSTADPATLFDNAHEAVPYLFEHVDSWHNAAASVGVAVDLP